MTTSLPSLPEGVMHTGKNVPDVRAAQSGERSWKVVWTSYRVHDLKVVMGWPAGHPMAVFPEPAVATVDFDENAFVAALPEGKQRESPYGYVVRGLTTAFWRSIPMAHAVAFLRPTYEKISLQLVRDDFPWLPTRVDTDEAYVHAAAAYVSLAAGGISPQPIRQLAEWSGESIETWSARIRRARSRGIIVGKGQHSAIASAFRSMESDVRERLSQTKEESSEA